MWHDTQLTRRLGLKVPIIQGPFGSGISSVDLVVAVCEAGGLGSFGVHHLDGNGIRDVAHAIRSRTDRPFALNLWIPTEDEAAVVTEDAFQAALAPLKPIFAELNQPLPQRPTRLLPRYEDQIEAVIEARPAVFSFVYGVPAPDVIRACRDRSITTLGTATTPEEALLLADAGVDMIVATGFEAGGHRVSFLRAPEDCLTGTLALIPQVVDAVNVPVIAAGGIADGRGIAAALMLGAQGVQIGTAFLACEESAASELHRSMLHAANQTQTGRTQTALTRGFTGRLARGIRNGLIDEMAREKEPIAPYPLRAWIFAQLKQAALAAGSPDRLALWCGQSAPLVKHRRARELIRALVAETTARIDGT
jgi:nitronate monooxygenase